jgi:preprotein translocase subunit SecD
MGCLAILGLIGLLFFGVRLAPGESPPTPIAAVAEPAQMMTPTPTPSGALLMASYGAEGANPMDLLTAASTIQTRIDLLDLQGASVVVSENAANPRLNVYVPRGSDTAHTLSLLTAPGYLELVDLSGVDGLVLSQMNGALLWTTGQAQQLGFEAPEGALSQPGIDAPFETVIDGFLVLEAEPILDAVTGQWMVQIHFDGSGALRLEAFTAAHVGDALGIVIDGKLISAPVIQSAIPGGTAVIQGNFTEREARELAVQLGSGPIRIKLELLTMG